MYTGQGDEDHINRSPEIHAFQQSCGDDRETEKIAFRLTNFPCRPLAPVAPSHSCRFTPKSRNAAGRADSVAFAVLHVIVASHSVFAT